MSADMKCNERLHVAQERCGRLLRGRGGAYLGREEERHEQRRQGKPHHSCCHHQLPCIPGQPITSHLHSSGLLATGSGSCCHPHNEGGPAFKQMSGGSVDVQGHARRELTAILIGQRAAQDGSGHVSP